MMEYEFKMQEIRKKNEEKLQNQKAKDEKREKDQLLKKKVGEKEKFLAEQEKKRKLSEDLEALKKKQLELYEKVLKFLKLAKIINNFVNSYFCRSKKRLQRR